MPIVSDNRGGERAPGPVGSVSAAVNVQPSAGFVHEEAQTSTEIHKVVVMRFTAKYLKSILGVLTIFEVVFVTLGLIFLATADSVYSGYLRLPLDWHLRVYVFSTVFAMLYSIASFIIHVYRLTESMRVPWKKFNFISYCLLSFLLLFASSMVASAIAYYDNHHDGHIPKSSKRHLVIATILGYLAMALYGVSAYYTARQLQGFFDQFNPQRFPAQGASSQPTTPSTETAPVAMDNIMV